MPTPISRFVDALAVDLELKDAATDLRKRRLLRRLVDWAAAQGIALERELIFDPDTVERFCETALIGERSQATYRSTLRALAPQLTTKAPWQPRPVAVPRRRIAPPYRDDELALLVSDAANQPTAKKRRAAAAFLALGLGAGLDGRWITRVAARDVERVHGGVVVRVGAPSPRSVVVRAAWEEEVLLLAATAGEQFLVGGHSLSRNRSGHLTTSFVVPTGHPPIAPARLRSTWLLHHLRDGTRLPELCRAAGLFSMGMFTELLGEIAPLSEEEQVALLRGGR